MEPQETGAYLDAVERSAGKTFRYRREITALIDASADGRAGADFAAVTFLSKFLVNASQILRRTGLPPEETEHLSSEFSASVEQVAALLRRILRHAGDDVRMPLERKFLAATPASLGELLGLAGELAWIKNYELDRASKN